MSVYKELFPGAPEKSAPYSDLMPESIVRAICALADEVRAQRLQALEFEQAEVAAREQEAAARVERDEMMKSQMEGFRQQVADLPPSQTTILVPDVHRPARAAFIPACACNHGIVAHVNGGPCELCDCKGYHQEAGTAL